MAKSRKTVLFDLDGTLIDTAPDLSFAVNEARRRRGSEPLSLEDIRPTLSHGSIAMTTIAIDALPGSASFEEFRADLLQIYRDNIARSSRLFPGLEGVLAKLEATGDRWGIVTNKPTALTARLLEQLALAERAAVVVCGDTLEHSKPHPAPLLFAAQQLNTQPRDCVYIGDAQRDIAAGRAANMHTAVARYGYLQETDEPHTWGATTILDAPSDIWPWLQSL